MKHQRAVEARHHGLSPHSSAYKAEMAKARAKDEAAIASQYGQSSQTTQYDNQSDDTLLCCGEVRDPYNPENNVIYCCEIL